MVSEYSFDLHYKNWVNEYWDHDFGAFLFAFSLFLHFKFSYFSAMTAEGENNGLIKLRLVEFSETSPELWFMTTETLFRTHNIAGETHKFAYLIQSIKVPQLERIKSVIEAGEAEQEPYNAAKVKLMDAFGETESRKFQKLLDSSLVNSTEIKPTHLLEKIKNLAGKFFKEDAIKEMWLNRILSETRLMIQWILRQWNIRKRLGLRPDWND